jgi:hypothetical protein
MERWISQLNIKCENLLDIGGSQLPIKDRVQSFEVDKYLILDIEKPHECKKEPDIIFDINDKIVLKKNFDPKFIGFFDRVFMLEVTEYLFNPVRAFKNCNLMMRDGGIMYLSSHFIYPIHNPKDNDYLRYTPKGIEKILEITGFEIMSNTPRLEKDIMFLEGEGFATTIMNWFRHQDMRPSKDYSGHNVVGSLIKCKKIKNLYISNKENI